MSGKQTKSPIIKAPKTGFQYRNIKKEFTIFETVPEITEQRHLENTENNGTKIVDDRNIDWFELAQKDRDQVGLANILAIANRNKQNLAQFAMRNADMYALKDDECADLSAIDPMNPDKMQALAEQRDISYKKLEGLAKQLDLSVDDLINAVMTGGLEKIISAKVESNKESEVKE